LDKEEIVQLEAGQNMTAKYKGAFYSDRAVRRVMDAIVKRASQ
jgi:hypothetical protein